MIENSNPILDIEIIKNNEIELLQFIELIKLIKISSLDELNQYKTQINQHNDIILADIKENQLKKKELEIKKQKLLQQHQNDILNIKIQFKSNQLSSNERELYLKDRITNLERDLNNINTEWNNYIKNIEEKKAFTNETIDVLKDEISNKDKDIYQKLERNKTLELTKQWINDKRLNKSFITKTEKGLNDLTKELEILTQNQTEWIENEKTDYHKNINELKSTISNLEMEINQNNLEISKMETNIKEIDNKIIKNNSNNSNNNNNISINNELDNIKWGLRNSLGGFNQTKHSLNDKYQTLLIELNNLQESLKKKILNDPFKAEIKILKYKIDKNNNSINKIKNRETSIIQKNKLEHIENKNKFHKTHLEIKSLNDKLNEIDLNFKIQETRYLESSEYKLNKITQNKTDLDEHFKFIEKLKEKFKLDNLELTKNYNIQFNDVNALINNFNEILNKLKTQSNILVKNLDKITKDFQKNKK
jgi:hypothetical protein